MSKRFKVVQAILNPSPTHIGTFKEEYKQFFGKEFTFKYMYIMGEKDMYPGTWALTPLDYSENGFCCSWVPEFDLDIIENAVLLDSKTING